MTIRIAQCFIPVDDHDKAVAFYQDVLGLQVRTDFGQGALRWVTVGPAGQPEVQIVLEPAAKPGAAEPDQQAIAGLMSKGLIGRVDFTADDVDGLFQRVQAAGAEVIQEPTDQHYGARDCAFRDPAGNQVRFSQPKS
jgi:catechol 2,3-dioxygenase-like lactoylglutathione lyase family enzyme